MKRFLLVGVVVVSLLVSATEGLKCVQCAPTCPSDKIPEATACATENDKGCGKIVSKVGGKEIIMRTCLPLAPKDGAEKCENDSCAYSCLGDGCNSAPPSASALNPLVTWGVTLGATLYFCFKQ